MVDNYYIHHLSNEYTLLQIDVQNSLRNYNYLLHNNTQNMTIAIDPTNGAITDIALKHHNWGLHEIWLTHHHNDHIGGVNQLVQNYGCMVMGNAADAQRLPPLNCPINAEQFSWCGLDVSVLQLDGHTIGHIGYHIPALNLLFAGDVIFSLGCGRVFEGTHSQAYQSLQKIAALPPETILCIAHEYTLDNAYFALHVEAENILLHNGGLRNVSLQQRVENVRELRAAKQPTVPSLLELELATNPFLRVDNVEDFTILRQLKDSFQRS